MVFATKLKNNLFISFADFAFSVFLFTEFMFKHSRIGQLGILLFLLSVIFLIISKQIFYFSYHLLFFISLILYYFINTRGGYSIDPQTSMNMVNTLFVNVIIITLLFNYLMIKKNLHAVLNILLKVSLWFTFCIFVLSIPSLASQRLGGDIRFLGLSASINPNSLSIVAGLAYSICLHNYIKNKRFFEIVKMSWFILIVFLSGSRKGLLLIILTSILLIYLLSSSVNKRFRNILLISLFLLSLFVLISNIPFLYNIIGVRFEAFINLIQGNEFEEGSLRTRNHFIEIGWNYFLQKPWRGYGLDNFRFLPRAYETYSHNNIIELLVSGGIPSLLLYYLPYFLILLMGLSNINNRNSVGKLIFSLFLSLVILDFAMVSYFDRLNLTIFIFELASFRLYSKEIQNHAFTDKISTSKSEFHSVT